jgi:hypothetical protein
MTQFLQEIQEQPQAFMRPIKGNGSGRKTIPVLKRSSM